MKAVQYSRFGGPEVLEVVELSDPEPGPGQVRVAVRAAAINPIDWKVRSGMMGGELPQQTGREVAGVVDRLGDGVSDVAPGDRVFGFVRRRGRRRRVRPAVRLRPDPALAGLRRGRRPAGGSRDGRAHARPPRRRRRNHAARQRRRRGRGQRRGADRAVARRACDRHGQPGQSRLPSRAGSASRSVTGRGWSNGSAGSPPVAWTPRSTRPASGVLPELVELAGRPEHVVTIADYAGAEQAGVRLQRRDGHDAGRARAAGHRGADRVGPVLAPGGADIPARADRRGAPSERDGSCSGEIGFSARLRTGSAIEPLVAQARGELLFEWLEQREPGGWAVGHCCRDGPSGSPGNARRAIRVKRIASADRSVRASSSPLPVR